MALSKIFDKGNCKTPGAHWQIKQLSKIQPVVSICVMLPKTAKRRIDGESLEDKLHAAVEQVLAEAFEFTGEVDVPTSFCL